MEAAGADGEGLGQTQKSESKCPRLSPHFVPCLKDAQDPPSYLLAFFSPHYSLTRPEGDLEYSSPSVLDRLKSLLSPTMPLALFGESCSSVGQETPNQPCGSHPFSSGFTAHCLRTEHCNLAFSPTGSSPAAALGESWRRFGTSASLPQQGQGGRSRLACN